MADSPLGSYTACIPLGRQFKELCRVQGIGVGRFWTACALFYCSVSVMGAASDKAGKREARSMGKENTKGHSSRNLFDACGFCYCSFSV